VVIPASPQIAPEISPENVTGNSRPCLNSKTGSCFPAFLQALLIFSIPRPHDSIAVAIYILYGDFMGCSMAADE
jgi:hypothetical protein